MTLSSFFTQTGRHMHTLSGHQRPVTALLLLPSVTRDGEADRPVISLIPSDGIQCPPSDNTSEWLITASSDKTIQVSHDSFENKFTSTRQKETLFPSGRENTCDYFPSLRIGWGAAEVNMAREIIKMVLSFRGQGKESVLWRSVCSLLNWTSTRKCETKASCLCAASVCKCSASAGSLWWSPKWLDWFFPSAFVSSQIAQAERRKLLERLVFGSRALCSAIFVTSFFFFQIEDLENS